MNLLAITTGAIAAVNPQVTATVRQSSGVTTSADGSRTPVYTSVILPVQVQSLTYNDLVQLDGLGIQGTRRAIYVDAQVFAAVRVDQKGGDLIVFAPGVMPEGTVWLCAQVLESWPGFSKICVTLQDGS